MLPPSLCLRLEGNLAVEPNPGDCEVLNVNLGTLGLAYRVADAAVSDRRAHGDLVFPRGPNDPDSAYIRQSPSGTLPIRPLIAPVAEAGLDLKGKDMVLKLEVEGQEISTGAGEHEGDRRGAPGLFLCRNQPRRTRSERQYPRGTARCCLIALFDDATRVALYAALNL